MVQGLEFKIQVQGSRLGFKCLGFGVKVFKCSGVQSGLDENGFGMKLSLDKSVFG